MQTFVKYALLFSAIGIGTKLFLWKQGYLIDNPEFSGMEYLLFLMLTSFFSLYEKRKKQKKPTTYIVDFKYGMKSVALFALIISVFAYGFYIAIDPEYFPNKIAERLTYTKNNIDMSVITNPMKLTKEEMIEKELVFSQMIYNPLNHSVISLFIFIILGGIYSSIITWLVRKLV